MLNLVAGSRNAGGPRAALSPIWMSISACADVMNLPSHPRNFKFICKIGIMPYLLTDKSPLCFCEALEGVIRQDPP